MIRTRGRPRHRSEAHAEHRPSSSTRFRRTRITSRSCSPGLATRTSGVHRAAEGATPAGDAEPVPRHASDAADPRDRRPGRRRQAGRLDLARRGRQAAPARRHPPGRPRRHARPDGDRRTRPRHQPGDPAARSSRAARQGRTTPTIRLGVDHDDRRRRRREVEPTPTPSGVTGRRAIARAMRRTHRRHRAGPVRRSPRSRSTGCAPTSGCATARPSSSRPRPVTVARFDLARATRRDLDVTVDCSTGTYVRALARDLGERARRRRPPDRAAAYQGRRLRHRRRRRRSSELERELTVMPLADAVGAAFPRIDVSDEEARRISSRPAAGARASRQSPAGVSRPDGRVIALVEDRDGVAQPLCVFA